MNHLVCETCWTGIFDTEGIQRFWVQEGACFTYKATWLQISQAAENACHWCSFLLSALPQPDTVEWPSSWKPTTNLFVTLDVSYLMPDTSPDGLNQCQIDFSSDDSSREWHIEVDLFLDDPNEPARIVTARPLQPVVNSAQVYSRIREWLHACNNHAACGKMPFCVDLPSRSIEVAPENSPGVPRIRSTLGVKGTYLALSYCWGGSQSYVLTGKNLDLLWRELDMERLPQTILNAIEVTKALGFKYLCVDALCIRQDSDETDAKSDMDQELAVMDQIYQNATMTIVAACALSIADGFLGDRPCPKQKSFRIPCRFGPGQFFEINIHEHKMYDDRNEPINTRAWTFQEQLLSPRKLIYASHTLQWQCSTMVCNLGGSLHSPNPTAAPRLPSAQMILASGQKQHEEYGSTSSEISHPILQHWLRIVATYSSRSASFPNDKLNAIAAVAKSCVALYGPSYKAGIWARSAVKQLCWSRANDRVFLTPPNVQYRAPSWSWAALDGPVYFPSFAEVGGNSACVPDNRFEIINWETTLEVSSLPYGQVKAGELTVKAALRYATFDPSRSPNLHFDWITDEDVSELVDRTPRAGSTLMKILPGKADTVEDNYTRRVRCLGMYRNTLSVWPDISGLMLVEAPRANGTLELRRLGTFSAHAFVFEESPLETVCIL